MNIYSKIISIAFVVIVFGISNILKAEVAVIVNPNNASSLSDKDIKRIFLGKMKKFPNGDSVIAVNLASGDKVRGDFEKKAVGKSASQMKAYWSKLVFSGKGNPPKEVSNDAEMIDLVANNPSVIGYIDESKTTDKVKVITKF